MLEHQPLRNTLGLEGHKKVHTKQLDLFQRRVNEFYSWAPPYPYCSDDLEHGCHREPLAEAREKPYIQTNGKYQHSIVIDCDYPNSFFADEDNNFYRPNWTTINNRNGHTQHFYCIVPVKKNDWNQTKAMRLLAKTQLGITRRLKGDLGFTNFLTKTVGHDAWRTEHRSDVPYTLTELVSKLDPCELNPITKAEEEFQLGRNCSTFNRVRKWSYRAVLKHNDYQSWLNCVLSKVLEDNTRYSSPMNEYECKGLARSIAKWTFSRFSGEKFSQIQAARGSLKGAKLRDAVLPTVIELRSQGLTQQEISDHTGISRRTIGNWLKRKQTELM